MRRVRAGIEALFSRKHHRSLIEAFALFLPPDDEVTLVGVQTLAQRQVQARARAQMQARARMLHVRAQAHARAQAQVAWARAQQANPTGMLYGESLVQGAHGTQSNLSMTGAAQPGQAGVMTGGSAEHQRQQQMRIARLQQAQRLQQMHAQEQYRRQRIQARPSTPRAKPLSATACARASLRTHGVEGGWGGRRGQVSCARECNHHHSQLSKGGCD